MKRTMLVLGAAALLGGAFSALSPAGAQEPPPQTGFEEREGASWTTHEEELAFLAEVDERSARVEMAAIGQTIQQRPMHLVRVGAPAPATREEALARPTTVFVCSQHGNEPAGREACLQALRDLAFTDDPGLVQLLSEQAFLFVPTANPDGRANNTRGNAQGTDINRDHLGLRTPEARAIAAVVGDWEPDLSIDLHEYGPSVPVLYDDEILFLWPRNLNVEKGIHDLAEEFAREKIEPCSEEAGYSADEYGIYAAGDVDVTQTAGGSDEGIMRNAMGLRHSLGILIESAVSADVTNNLGEEALSSAANQRRRVASQSRVIDCTLEWVEERGQDMMEVTATAPLRKQGEGMAQNVPVYFGGADNEPPSGNEEVYPPMCAYDLSPADLADAEQAMALHGIEAFEQESGTFRVPMGQSAEPLIPLLLDGRGDRNIVSATAVAAPPLDATCSPPKDEAGGAGVPLAMAGTAAVAGIGSRLRRR